MKNVEKSDAVSLISTVDRSLLFFTPTVCDQQKPVNIGSKSMETVANNGTRETVIPNRRSLDKKYKCNEFMKRKYEFLYP